MTRKSCWIVCTVLTIGRFSDSATASMVTIGLNGINSAGLKLFDGTTPLTGAGIGIGQVENGRPGKRVMDGGFDDAMHSNTTIKPANVFIKTLGVGAQLANVGVEDHAERVAGIMISTHPTETGVATGAELYSSAIFPIGPDFDSEAAITTQHIATQKGGDIRAINLSFAIALAGPPVPNGNALYTLFVDWSAKEHDVLYVAAGNHVFDANVVPTDNFNGITVAASEQVDGTGAYRRIWVGNRYDADAHGDRTSIALIAPAVDVGTTGLANVFSSDSGTSFAPPHVTGTVALLQEYAEERIMNVGGPQWSADARRHEVMKAVLMNSADKLIDNETVVVNGNVVPPGSLLGMERTVLKKNGSTWLNSDAYDKSYGEGTGLTVPLDLEMGAGHLNAKRALQQFSPGEHDADGAAVPVIGWDLGNTNGVVNSTYHYEFDQPLLGGSFISITLAWDRVVEFDVDGGTQGVYDIGDTFVESTDIVVPGWEQYSDLDIYLLHADDFTINQAIAASTSSTNLEHLFFQIPETGDYKFWIRQHNANAGPVDYYAVAWWALADQPVVMQPGDFDGDGDVDGADFVAWQTNFPTASGATLADGDADGDGDVDGADFVVWQTNFPTSPGPGTVPVPEPASCLLFALGGLWAWRRADRSVRSSRSCPDGD